MTLPPGFVTSFDLAQQDEGLPFDLAADLSSVGGAPCTTCTITLVGGTVAAEKADGGSWDSGSPPDPYVNLKLANGTVKRSSTISDSTTVVWNQIMFANLPQTQVLAGFTVTLMDEDPLNADDTMASWQVTPTLSQLSTGTITLTSGVGAEMTSTITLTIK